MKICYLANGDSRSVHAQRFMNFFAERYDVSLITFHGLGDIDKSVDTHYIPVKGEKISINTSFTNVFRKSIEFLKFIRKSKRMIKKINPDILHAFYLTNYGLCGALSGFHPIVVSPWGDDIAADPNKNIIFNKMIKYVLKNADLIQCMDKSFQDRVFELIGKNHKTVEIPEGIYPEMFKPSKRPASDKIKILNLRKSEPPYSTEIFVKAIPKVVEKCKNVEFVMRNSGWKMDETKKMVKKMGIEKYVNFIEDEPYEKMPELLNSVDIYVDTFYRETKGSGVGKTALEAMSCELPVVFSNSAGAEIHIKNGKNGMIYEGLNPDSLANVLIKLIENKKLREQLGKNGRKYVLKYQNFNKNMELMYKMYNDIVDEK